MPDRNLEGSGTPEELWRGWAAMRSWPVLDLTRPPAVAVVVAPHPDDEVLGVGGLLAMLARSGTRIHVIAVTDGEASHPNSPTITRQALAAERTEESRKALAELRVLPAAVERLRLPDGDVRRVEMRSATITAAVLRALAKTAHLGDAWCLAPWRADGHPDHEATGQAAASGASGTARLLSYPVWMWHWAEPADPHVPWPMASRVPLTPDIREAKVAAVKAFRTQINPLSDHPGDAAILAPQVLRRLTRDTEIVFHDGAPAMA